MLAAGHTVNGAARWITFAGFQFQPSEFSKLLLIVGLAALLAVAARHHLARAG